MRARVLTALALIPPVLAAVFCTDPWPLLILCLVILWVASEEVNRLINGKFALAGSLLWVGLAFASAGWGPGKLHYQFIALTGAVVFLLGVLATGYAGKEKQSNFLLDVLAAGWVAGPVSALIGIHMVTAGETPPWFRFDMPILLAIVPLWAGDTAAIFAGKAFGKHKLAPTISPKKTVEGAIANLIACVLAAWGLGILLLLPDTVSLLCGVSAGIFGQMGDLFESWIKRQANLKDSGTLLPGHGGVLDRIDSILFTSPLVGIILVFWPK